MTHPLTKLAPHSRKRVFLVGLLVTSVLTFVLGWLGRGLKTAEAPNGIVSFELAGNQAAAHAMIASWHDPAIAWLSLEIDFLYLLAYATTLALACLWVTAAAEARGAKLRRIGVATAWAQWAAALLDATENVALMAVLADSPAELWPRLARACATAKFASIGLGLIYMVGTLVVVVMRRQPDTTAQDRR
jgi:hypothetical protein